MFSGHEQFIISLLFLLLNEVFHCTFSTSLPSPHSIWGMLERWSLGYSGMKHWPCTVWKGIGKSCPSLKAYSFSSTAVSQLFQLLLAELHKAVKWEVVYYKQEHCYCIIKDLLLNHNLTNGFEALGVRIELIIKRERFAIPFLIGYKIWMPRTKSLTVMMDNL